jgi:hypothetical protein
MDYTQTLAGGERTRKENMENDRAENEVDVTIAAAPDQNISRDQAKCRQLHLNLTSSVSISRHHL